jgi:hypothetical protein
VRRELVGFGDVTKWYWLAGSRSSTRLSDALARRFRSRSRVGLLLGLGGRRAGQLQSLGDVRA